MVRTANTVRQFVIKGTPCATGLIPVADARGFTNPSAGRGITLGLMHVLALAPAVARHAGEPLEPAWGRETRQRVVPDTQFDRLRGPEVDPFRQHLPNPHDPKDRWWLDLVNSAIYSDAQVLQWVGEQSNCSTLPTDLASRPESWSGSSRVACANPPYRVPGPNQAALELLLA